MTEEWKKTLITAPQLPNTIQGDGRQLISLLRKYLKSVTEQVNVANGFTAEDIDATNQGDYIMPKNFTLTFDRLGGVLNWDAVNDDKLDCYELRTNTHIGEGVGLLERTKNTTSVALPTSASGRIYLYAVSTEGKVSNARVLNYNKARPGAPADLALTKNNEGTLITFLEIPSNCLGANLYIDGQKYTTLDNVYLYPGFDAEDLYIAYFDQFGEGEKAYFSCHVPNVTGFWVEKNGANLYFYWNAIAIYNVQYIVKVGTTRKWEQGVEIFRSKVNKYRYIRPNDGNYYYMIKAVDAHGNYSQNATWYYLSADPEINKNAVLDYDQPSLGYPEVKMNLYYDAKYEGLRMESAAFVGEYTMNVELPQTIRARNWIDVKVNAVTEQTMHVSDMTFAVESEEASKTIVMGVLGNTDGITLIKQISLYNGGISKAFKLYYLADCDFSLYDIKCEVTLDEFGTYENVIDDYFHTLIDGTANPGGGKLITEHNVTYGQVRWGKGALITDVTQLEYELEVPSLFSLGFWFKKNEPLNNCIILEMRGTSQGHQNYLAVQDCTFAVSSYEAFHLMADGIWRDVTLYLGYDKRLDAFYVYDTVDSRILTIKIQTTDRDWLFFGLAQDETSRLFYIREFELNLQKKIKKKIPPCTSFDRIYFNPKE